MRLKLVSHARRSFSTLAECVKHAAMLEDVCGVLGVALGLNIIRNTYVVSVTCGVCHLTLPQLFFSFFFSFPPGGPSLCKSPLIYRLLVH